MRSSLAVAIVVSAYGLIGCGTTEAPSVGDEAAKQYQIASDSSTAAENCARAKAVSEAYLQDLNQDKYREWRTIEEDQCRLAASIEKLGKAFKDTNDSLGF